MHLIGCTLYIVQAQKDEYSVLNVQCTLYMQ